MSYKNLYYNLKIIKKTDGFINDLLSYLNETDFWKYHLENYEINEKIYVKKCTLNLANENLRESITATIDVVRANEIKPKEYYTYCLFNINMNGEISSNIIDNLDDFFINLSTIIRKYRISYFI